jgi:transcription-repair coupling factor (superfamily II helicase)
MAEKPQVLEHGRRSLKESAVYRELLQKLGTASRLPMPAAALVFGELARDLGRPLLVVLSHESDAYAWLEASRLFAPPSNADEAERVAYFSAPSLLPYQEADTSLAVRAEESRALGRIVAGGISCLLTTPRALCRRLPRPEHYAGARLELKPGDDVAPLDLLEHLQNWGYHRSDLVFEVGQMALRGGVFDVFPPGELQPLRFDLFGDTIESIRYFEPESQRSTDSAEEASILPLSLFPQGPRWARKLADALHKHYGMAASAEIAERIASLRDGSYAAGGNFDGWQNYLPLLHPDTVSLAELIGDPLILTVDHAALHEELSHHEDRMLADFRVRQEQGRLAAPPEALEHPVDAVRELIERAPLRLGGLFVQSREAIDFAGTSTEILHDKLQLFPREVETAISRGDRVALVVAEDHLSKMAEMLRDLEIPLGARGVELVGGDLQRGFRLPAAKLTVWSERQLLRRSPLVRREAGKNRKKLQAFLGGLRDLKVGDYVVHTEHGIGQFVQLRTLGGGPQRSDLPPELQKAMPEAAADVEVMEIAYSGGKRLLLPLSRLDQIQKFSGIEGIAPRLDQLGGSSWNRTKSRIKSGLRDMAEELIRLYAARQLAQAPQMTASSELEARFDASFEFDETADQLEAIGAIYEDMSQSRPMDRLLCGDVGFGKTEVAMRAALRAVDNGYQVAVLAPTTILADQHLETFRRRFAGLPVVIDMISRFRTPAEVKEISAKVTSGNIDILIGTHRLLAKEIGWKRLGLVIIDEEQRFGVAHKERLKQLRKDIHVLAMSATPVPRTLQLSLADVRDLSLIETPPRDRMAVETAILPFDARMIREAIEYELARGGQVYYVYNRVESIDEMATTLREILPGLTITVGHGQLDEKELSKRMHAFTRGEYQVLLATTIIENGIDIPNVNTMIVHNAERFGLAQLYQLRGRVGRSDQLAFCYLLVASDKILTEDARKRLEAIREFTELGAGFRVAGRDLEIRGAGNLLGAEQSGHIGAVGIETYLKLLEEAVAELRGEKVEEAPSVTLDLPVSMSIPESYVADANLRMEIYQRVAIAEGSEAEVVAELRDRFGTPPESVLTLIQVAGVKRRAEQLRLQSITARGGKLALRLRQDARIDPSRLIELLHQRPGCHFSPTGTLTVDGVRGEDSVQQARELLEYLAGDPLAGQLPGGGAAMEAS